MGMDPALTGGQVCGVGTQRAGGMSRPGREQTLEALERRPIFRYLATMEREPQLTDRPLWTVEEERRFRSSGTREAAQGSPTPQRRDALLTEQAEVRANIQRPATASLSIHSRPGGNLFVAVTVEGRDVSALVDTGSSRTLLDASWFPHGPGR